MMRGRKILSALCAVILLFSLQGGALAWQAGTLYPGVKDTAAVQKMQEALIALGYLGGTPDGIFGTHTQNALKKFQKASGLKADGIAGAKTLEVLYQKAGMTADSTTQTSENGSATTASTISQPTAPTSTQPATPANAQASTPVSTQPTAPTSTQSATNVSTGPSSSGSTSTTVSASSGSGLFGGDYSTLRLGNTGTRVKALQQQLIALGYLKGSADGKFGKQTRLAVIAFQKANKLTADGLAGKKTLLALENSSGSTTAQSSASQATSTQSTSTESTQPSTGTTTPTAQATGPNGSEVKLLHWFDDVKPTLKSGQTLYIYEPTSGQGWNLRIYSCGRHCDAEPSTAEDTASMLKAFGGQKTWSQKAVYVRLPSGVWTIGSTHDMPHMSGSVKDNNFNGHLCVHFFRTMSEAKQNDPNYGVSNQNTIREFWLKLTGENITD